MNKSYRQGQILNLIRRKPIHTQEELARELAACGISATQVTLSRDIRELGIVKTPSGYRQLETNPHASGIASAAAEFLRDIRVAQHTVVLKTSPGNASALAVCLDREDWPEIVGTVAGDDTILVVAPDNATARALHAKLLRYLR
jgi:transcriptional regulator of arginine metabolism